MPNSKKFMIDFGFYHIFQIFVKLFANNMKGGLRSLKFCVLANQLVPSKKSENNIFLRGPLHGANIGQIFFKIYCQKIFVVSFKSYVQLVPKIY